jgi:hypothetical protein
MVGPPLKWSRSPARAKVQKDIDPSATPERKIAPIAFQGLGFLDLPLAADPTGC